MTKYEQLTQEQKNIVNHDLGPALVFAVAGSGKTTSMVHRIKRLVDERIVEPKQILATSFSKATVTDIQNDLEQLNIKNIEVRTLHSLGRFIIKHSVEKKLISVMPELIDSSVIAYKAVLSLCKGNKKEIEELEINTKELETFISICKGNMIYADLDQTLEDNDFPKEAIKLMAQAEHINDWYVKAYKRYEEIRKEKDWYTFDDQLLSGWECLVKYNSIRRDIQNKYKMILVDEFQDVNSVQYHTLNILQRIHKNYMVIGDDDQCIYEWRGAKPEYILKFENTYTAKKYLISDNFRSTGHQIFLANDIIKKNERREDKTVNLTKGFDGQTTIKPYNNSAEEATYIVNNIKELVGESEDYSDIVVLLRMWGDSTSLQAELLENKIKFDIDGNQLFFKRTEIRTLLDYLRFCDYESRFDKILSNKDEMDRYAECFKNIIWKPKRYIKSSIIKTIVISTKNKKKKITELLRESTELKKYKNEADNFLELIETIQILMEDESAHFILKVLQEEIDYKDYLKRSSGMDLFAIEKIRSVTAFINYCNNKGCVRELLDHIEYLNQDFKDYDKQSEKQWLKITTVYKAKGLEWDIVFIPSCNVGSFPPAQVSEEDIEGERRLFYVGVTRAKKNLHISYTRETDKSPFLQEIEYKEIINNAQKTQAILEKSVESYDNDDVLELTINTERHFLRRYLEKWCDHFHGDTKKETLKTKLEAISKESEKALDNKTKHDKANKRYLKDLEKWETYNKSRKKSKCPTRYKVKKARGASIINGMVLQAKKEKGVILFLDNKNIVGTLISGTKTTAEEKKILNYTKIMINKIYKSGLLFNVEIHAKRKPEKNLTIKHNPKEDILVVNKMKRKMPVGSVLTIRLEESFYRFYNKSEIIGEQKIANLKINLFSLGVSDVILTKYSKNKKGKSKSFWVTLKAPLAEPKKVVIKEPTPPKQLSEKVIKSTSTIFRKGYNILANIFSAKKISKIARYEDKVDKEKDIEYVYDSNVKKNDTLKSPDDDLPF